MSTDQNGRRLLADKSNIWLVGLKAMDARVIRNFVYLVKDLKRDFNIVDDCDAETADIIFVNIENKEACNLYRSSIKAMQHKPILVKCSSRNSAEGVKDVLPQPVTRKDLEALLRSITSTNPEKSYVSKSSLSSIELFRVLVVDDSFPVRKYMEEKLPYLAKVIGSQICLEVDFGSSGEEAVKAIKARRGQYEIVFLDVVMNDVDGYKVCKWIKNASERIKVVMLTSKNSTFDKVRGKIAGCDGYLSKPPTDKELMDVMLKSIESRHLNDGTRTKHTQIGT